MAAAVQARGGGLVRLRVRQDHEVIEVECEWGYDVRVGLRGGGRQRRSWRARAALVEALGIERYDNPSSAAKLVLLQAQPGAVLADVSPGEHMCMVLSALLGLLACPDLEVQVYNEIAGLLAGVEQDHGRALRQRIGGKLREAVEVLEEYVAHLRSISDSAQLPKAEHELREALEMWAAPADTDDSMLEVDTVKVVVDIMTGLDINVLVVSLVDQQELGGHVTAAYSRTTHVALHELAVSGGGALELPSCSTVVLFFAHNHANSVLLGKVGDQKTEVEVLLDMAAETHDVRWGSARPACWLNMQAGLNPNVRSILGM
ncbi:hypothetical protein CHLRE_12g537950v5 [Chlamydomonas reinhardtii]|uniref:Uncharacterized protein n=1 Tax=Chlamydomonas reinhardtii TaxID=3055 RepID=A0A2K3D5A2_CHLRE|nr:uncharacterized protein CHLRE_12g537950v5 [Chlamydomonas reinhardtii]PNW75713.1 hypothetical protein CHLRE_12g537950v5 [Chlamydomonas reinhardtii]